MNIYIKKIPISLLLCFTAWCSYAQKNFSGEKYDKHNEISWDKTNNNIIYEVYRAPFGNDQYKKIGETKQNTYVDYIGNLENQNFNYKMKSRNPSDKNTSRFSRIISLTGERPQMTESEYLDMVQKYTFRYFWDFADPVSGMIYESQNSIHSKTATTGGTGFGLMAIPVGISRKFITYQSGLDRVIKIVDFLKEKTTRFHGAWSHWIHSETGAVIPFSNIDNGADLLETALLVQGLLVAKDYFKGINSKESNLRRDIQDLWEGVEWDWFKQDDKDYLSWHWSPDHQWGENLAIQGWNEGLIAYILAISSPTHSVDYSLYDTGWARNGNMKSGKSYYNHILPLGENKGGPLFLTHYSFLGLDPIKIGDKYIDSYYEQGREQTLINRSYCMENPKNYQGYNENLWGITASQSPPPEHYKAHEPTAEGDNGTIAPTGSIASMPYTPKESMSALKYLYNFYGNKLWGNMGFYDAINPSKGWASSDYLAIDQGPILLMIENYRSQLIWKTFMNNVDIVKGLNSIPSINPIDYSYEPVEKNTLKVFINGVEQLRGKLGVTNRSNRIPIKAVIGDEITLEVYNLSEIPKIEGLPDTWIARAFINEGIFMSSKSITPGAYRPWIPYSTVSHTTLLLPFNRDWLDPSKYAPNRYPMWKRIGNKYRLKWTLQRTMDAHLTYKNKHIDQEDMYPDQEVPWWQTWDNNGNPIVDNTGKFNQKGQVPFGEHPKLDGTYPQRQGKNVGMDMITLKALNGKLKTAYGDNTNFSDNSSYFVKSDGDDTYTTAFKDLTIEPFHVVDPSAKLYRPFTELWKVVPDKEMNNPVSEIVTWYQKSIHQEVGNPLASNYKYNGYEIWENSTKNPSSKAPGKISVSSNNQFINFYIDVISPLEDDRFYTLYKANDNDNVRDKIVSTNELTIGIEQNVKSNLIHQIKENNSKFDLVLGHSTWDPKYVVHPLTLNDDGSFSGDKTFDLSKIGPGPALHVFISYRRTPEAEPVIISGTDFWISSNIEALRCEEYHNESESRTLRKSDFAINSLNEDNHISVSKHLHYGYNLSRMNEEYTIKTGEKLTFRIWDNVDFAFQQMDTKWYMSSRKRKQQLSESDAAKRVKITLYELDESGNIKHTRVLQDLNTGTSLLHAYTFNKPGSYIYEAALERDHSDYRVFIKVLNEDKYNTGEEARVQIRKLLPREVRYINATLENKDKINASDYKLAMVTDVQAHFSWKSPKEGGAPRSFMNSDRTVKYIDRFAPFNDYSDYYVYQIDNQTSKSNTQNISVIQKYLEVREPQFKMLPGVWVNHLDPLGESPNKYGIQDVYNLESRIKDIDSKTVENLFTQVQETYADEYMVTVDGKSINSRSPRKWELRLPWGSLSKYHGFRLRTAPKSPVNAKELKKAILDIGKQGGGFFEQSMALGSGGSYGVRTTSGGSEGSINPLLNPKSGILDTDEQRLEYAFLLNLKHNRWVVVPKDAQNISFYHGDLQDNIVASSSIKNPESDLGAYDVSHTSSNSGMIKNALISTGVIAAVGIGVGTAIYFRQGISNWMKGYKEVPNESAESPSTNIELKPRRNLHGKSHCD